MDVVEFALQAQFLLKTGWGWYCINTDYIDVEVIEMTLHYTRRTNIKYYINIQYLTARTLLEEHFRAALRQLFTKEKQTRHISILLNLPLLFFQLVPSLCHTLYVICMYILFLPYHILRYKY